MGQQMETVKDTVSLVFNIFARGSNVVYMYDVHQKAYNMQFYIDLQSMNKYVNTESNEINRLPGTQVHIEGLES